MKYAHPGVALAKLLKQDGRSVRALAKALKEYHPNINDVVNCNRRVTPRLALKLEAEYGVKAEEWVVG